MQAKPKRGAVSAEKIPQGNTMVASRTLRARLLSSLAAEVGSDLTFERATMQFSRARNKPGALGDTDVPLFGPRGLYLEPERTNLIGANLGDPAISFINILSATTTDELDGTAATIFAEGGNRCGVAYYATDIVRSCRMFIKFHRMQDPRAMPAFSVGTFGGETFGYILGTEENIGEWIEVAMSAPGIGNESPLWVFALSDYKNIGAPDAGGPNGSAGYVTAGDAISVGLAWHAESDIRPGQIVPNVTTDPITAGASAAYADIADLPAWNAEHTIAFRAFFNMKAGSGSDWNGVFIVDGETADSQRAVHVNEDGTIRARCGLATVIESDPGLIKNGGSYDIVYTSDGAAFSLWVDGVLIGTETAVNPGGAATQVWFVGSGVELSDVNFYSEHADTAQKVNHALDAR